jgi:hypothetical protein
MSASFASAETERQADKAAASVSAAIKGDDDVADVVVAVVVCVEEDVVLAVGMVKEDGEGDVREDDAVVDCG